MPKYFVQLWRPVRQQKADTTVAIDTNCTTVPSHEITNQWTTPCWCITDVHFWPLIRNKFKYCPTRAIFRILSPAYYFKNNIFSKGWFLYFSVRFLFDNKIRNNFTSIKGGYLHGFFLTFRALSSPRVHQSRIESVARFRCEFAFYFHLLPSYGHVMQSYLPGRCDSPDFPSLHTRNPDFLPVVTICRFIWFYL